MVSIINSINLNVTNALKNEDNYFTIKKYTFNNNEYKIIKYSKDVINSIVSTDFVTYLNVSKFRSVIVRNNKVVCFAPEKSLDYTYFKNEFS